MFNYQNINKNVKKKKKIDKRTTLDAIHNKQMIKYLNQEKNVPDMMIMLKKMLIEKEKLSDINEIRIIDEKIKLLKKNIIKYKNKKNIINYYLNTGNFLCNYYNKNKKNNKDNKDDKNNIENKNIKTENKLDEKKPKVINFYNLFNTNNTNNTKSNKSNKSNTDSLKKKKFKNTKIANFMETEYNFNRTDYLDEYLKMTKKKHNSSILYNHDENMCPSCKIELTEYKQDGLQICSECGFQKRFNIENDKPSFKDPPPEVSYFAYKRINHFNECLTQFQGKESTIIPKEVYNSLLLEIKKEKITNLASLDYTKIRKYLKKLKLNKYYEHIPHILNRINGISPPILSKQLEEKLRLMFKEIQIPFREVCPKNRKNFLSYYYILHKFVELLDLDEFKYYFPLLKDKNKLYQTDLIWKKICKKLGWQFIKSI